MANIYGYIRVSTKDQNKTAIIKTQKDEIVQFPSILQQGDLINPGQEIVSIIPKEEQKK